MMNDGDAIVCKMDIAHPVAKNKIESSRTEDKEWRDGTTSVIIAARRGRVWKYSLLLVSYVFLFNIETVVYLCDDYTNLRIAAYFINGELDRLRYLLLQKRTDFSHTFRMQHHFQMKYNHIRTETVGICRAVI